MAKSTVVWTATAVKQRRAILKYWTQKTHSTAYAEKLIKLIKKRVKVIANFPELWKLTSYPDSRISVMGNFSIVYKISDGRVIIIAFWDNRQEPEKLLEIISLSKNEE